MSSTTITRHAEEFMGRPIRVVEELGHDGRPCLRIADGAHRYGYRSEVTDAAVASLAARARRDIALIDEEERLALELTRLALTGRPGDAVDGVIAEVGDIVVLHSRGALRVGLATQVTRTGTVTVAYVTRGGIDEANRCGFKHAQVTRKAAKAGEYGVIVTG